QGERSAARIDRRRPEGGGEGDGRVEAGGAAVALLDHVQVPAGVHGHAVRPVHAARPQVGGIGDHAGLAEDAVGGGVGGERRVIFEHAVVLGVGNEEVAGAVQR